MLSEAVALQRDAEAASAAAHAVVQVRAGLLAAARDAPREGARLHSTLRSHLRPSPLRGRAARGGAAVGGEGGAGGAGGALSPQASQSRISSAAKYLLAHMPRAGSFVRRGNDPAGAGPQGERQPKRQPPPPP